MSKAIIDNWPRGDDPLKTNIKQLLCDIANASGDDSWDGHIRNEGVDTEKFRTDPASFKGVGGDPRYSMGDVISGIYATFLPRLKARQEIGAAGGCQIINEYICDPDGNPIIRASQNCIDYINSGKVTQTTTNNGKVVNIERIQPQEVVDFVRNSYNDARKKNSDAFITYVKKTYITQGWTPHLYQALPIYAFYAQFTKKDQKNVYLRYYVDQKDYIAQQLNLPILSSEELGSLGSFDKNTDMTTFDYKNFKMPASETFGLERMMTFMACISQPIKDYTKLV